jgi:RNA polymerase sigma factor (sigma-70 family)
VRAAVSRHRSRDVALAADDLLQEVRIRVWTVYSGDRNSRLKTSYYYKVVNSAIIDSLRSHRGTLAHSVRTEHDSEEDEPALIERIGGEEQGPDSAFDEQHRKAGLLEAIRQLPADRRRAVRLFLQGFTVPEIAELLGCDRNRAHNLAYRGVRALKELMGEPE